jgi:hypothetical protein
VKHVLEVFEALACSGHVLRNRASQPKACVHSDPLTVHHLLDDTKFNCRYFGKAEQPRCCKFYGAARQASPTPVHRDPNDHLDAAILRLTGSNDADEPELVDDVDHEQRAVVRAASSPSFKPVLDGFLGACARH